MSNGAEAAQTALRTTGLAVVLAVVAALSLCTVFVPGPVELGAHLLNDREVGRAQVYLQAALERHGPLREIVLPLAKIELDHGRSTEVLRLLGDDDGAGGIGWTRRPVPSSSSATSAACRAGPSPRRAEP